MGELPDDGHASIAAFSLGPAGPVVRRLRERSAPRPECSIPDNGLRPRARAPVAAPAARGLAPVFPEPEIALSRRSINPARAESDRPRMRRSTVEGCVDSALPAVYDAPFVLDGSVAVRASDRTAFGRWRAGTSVPSTRARLEPSVAVIACPPGSGRTCGVSLESNAGAMTAQSHGS